MALENLKDHLLSAVATAAVLGGGTAVITQHTDLARLDERVARIEKLDDKMEKLDASLSQTQVALAKLEAADVSRRK